MLLVERMSTGRLFHALVVSIYSLFLYLLFRRRRQREQLCGGHGGRHVADPIHTLVVVIDRRPRQPRINHQPPRHVLPTREKTDGRTDPHEIEFVSLPRRCRPCHRHHSASTPRNRYITASDTRTDRLRKQFVIALHGADRTDKETPSFDKYSVNDGDRNGIHRLVK